MFWVPKRIVSRRFLCSGYPKESSQRDGSFVHQKHNIMVKRMGKKICIILSSKNFVYQTLA